MWEKTIIVVVSIFNILIIKGVYKFCTSVEFFQYEGIYLLKATTFTYFPASTGRELQPPSSCTGWYVYQYVGIDLQKATTFTLSIWTTFHKFSDWILLVHINTICRTCFIKFSWNSIIISNGGDETKNYGGPEWRCLVFMRMVP